MDRNTKKSIKLTSYGSMLDSVYRPFTMFSTKLTCSSVRTTSCPVDGSLTVRLKRQTSLNQNPLKLLNKNSVKFTSVSQQQQQNIMPKNVKLENYKALCILTNSQDYRSSPEIHQFHLLSLTLQSFCQVHRSQRGHTRHTT